MTIHSMYRKCARGYLLLEVVLAMGIFALVATGFTLALQKAADASDLAARETQVTRILQSAMDEAISVPALEEGETSQVLEERDMEIVTLYERMDEIENKDGQLLQEMWRITVTAYFFTGETKLNRSAVTWRYGRLYLP
jgi:type II secretory pathway pseudopilin PulG